MARRKTRAKTARKNPSQANTLGPQKNGNRIATAMRSPLRASAQTQAEYWRPPTWYVIVLAFFVGSPALLGTYGHKYGYSPDVHMASVVQVGGFLMLCLFFLSQIQRSTLYIRRMPVLTPAILLFLWACVTLFWVQNYYEAQLKLMDWGCAILGGLLLAHTLGEERHARWIFLGIFFGGCILLFIGMSQYFFDVKWVDQHAPPAITFNNKNMAAQFMLLIFPVGAGLAMCKNFSIYFRLFAVSVSLLTLLFIVFSNTRGSIIAVLAQLALLLALFTWILLKNQIRIRWKYVLIAAGLLLLAVFFSMSFSHQGLIDGWLKIYDRVAGVFIKLMVFEGETRFAIWGNTAGMIRDNLLFGVGVGGWAVEYPIYHREIINDMEMSLQIQHINTHQDYLEFFSELGLIGMACLAMIGIQALRITVKLIFSMETDDVYLAVAALVGIAGLAVNALGSFPFQQPAPVFLFMCYLGMLDFYWSRVSGEAPLASLGLRRVAMPAALAAAVGVVVMTVVHYAWYQSEIHFRLATIASRAGEEQKMILEAEDSLRWTPSRLRMANFLAMGLLRRGEYQQSANAFDSVLEVYPNLMHTLGNASMAYTQIGATEKSRQVLQHLLNVRPTPLSYMRMGAHLYSTGQREESLDYLRKALEPGNPPLSDEYRGQVVRLLRRMDNARRARQGEQAVPYVLQDYQSEEGQTQVETPAAPYTKP